MWGRLTGGVARASRNRRLQAFIPSGYGQARRQFFGHSSLDFRASRTHPCGVRLQIKRKRIITSCVCATLVAFGLLLWLIFWYDDIMPGDADYPPSKVDNAVAYVCDAAVWPLVFLSRILGQDPPGIFWLPLLVLSGAFWGVAIELVVISVTRKGHPESKLISN